VAYSHFLISLSGRKVVADCWEIQNSVIRANNRIPDCLQTPRKLFVLRKLAEARFLAQFDTDGCTCRRNPLSDAGRGVSGHLPRQQLGVKRRGEPFNAAQHLPSTQIGYGASSSSQPKACSGLVSLIWEMA